MSIPKRCDSSRDLMISVLGNPGHLKGNDLFNPLENLPIAEQYTTYNFEGNSQALDHILISKNLLICPQNQYMEINSDFGNQTSDHDPVGV